MSRIPAFFLPLVLFAGSAIIVAEKDAEAAVHTFAQEWVAAWNAHEAEAHAAHYADGAVLAWPGGHGNTVPALDRTADGGRVVSEHGPMVEAE